MTTALHVLRGLEELYPEIRFIERLREIVENHPNVDFGDMMSRGQIRSKQWIIHELIIADRTYLGQVAVCGGWYGSLSRIILDSPELRSDYISSMDLDIESTIIAGEFNREYLANGEFLSEVKDCCEVDYSDFDTIINTSCEHFEDFDAWYDRIPFGRLVILQSNNFFDHEEHVNCVRDVGELIDMAPMTDLIFSGQMSTHLYNRFMLIGVK